MNDAKWVKNQCSDWILGKLSMVGIWIASYMHLASLIGGSLFLGYSIPWLNIILLLGIVAKTDDKIHEVSAVSNGPSVEEPKSQEMPQHDVVAINSGHHTDDHHMSNLELENTLLRKEVASLNEEMVSVVQRAKEAEKSKYQSYCTMKEQNPNLPWSTTHCYVRILLRTGSQLISLAEKELTTCLNCNGKQRHEGI